MTKNNTTNATTNRNNLFSSSSLMLAAMVAAVGGAGLVGTPAWAQADAPNTYNVPHAFTLETKGNAPPVVTLIYKCETYARTKTCADKDKDKGEVIIGTGVTNKKVTSLAPSSTATAEAEANITDLKPGLVKGTVTAKGSAEASLAGCGKPVGSGYAEASSSAKIRAQGVKVDKKGKISWAGGWKHSKGVSGRATQRVAKDPIVARLIDHTTGSVSEWTLLSIKSTLNGGSTSWDGLTLSSDASNMTFEATVGAPVITQAGTIRVKVVDGIVTESIETGMFAGMGLPPVGAPTGFSVPMPTIALDFDLGGDDSHDLEPQFEMDGAAEENDAVAAVEDESTCTLVTDLSTGFDSNDLSTPTIGDNILGFTCSMGQFHLADDFLVPKGSEPLFLDSLDWPVYQTNAPHGVPIQSAFVRLWLGSPMPGGGGVPFAGDLSTNRLIDVRFPGVMRTPLNQPLNPQREIKVARLDMSWAPPLPPGQHIYIEIVAMGLVGLPGPFTPPSPYPNPEWDNALQFNVQNQQWQPALDQQSGRPVSIPFQLFSVGQGQTTCYPDCDQDGVLSIDDFICFQTLFALKDPFVDCDADDTLSIDDFICFQTLFAIGC